MAGKRQHYVPRLLQRGFLADSADPGERTWLHRLGVAPKLVGIRHIGVEDWFYSRRSGDGQATLDDAITELEGDLQHDLASLRAARSGSAVSGETAAPLVTHLATRTAFIRTTMGQLLSTFSDEAAARLGTPEGLRRVMGLDAHEATDPLRKAVANAIADMPLEQFGVPPAFVERLMLFMAREIGPTLLQAQAEQLAPLLATLARGAGDKIRDGHNRALELPPERTGWSDVMRKFAWRLEPGSNIVLPDCVALAREATGELVPFFLSSGTDAEAVLLPLAADRVLVGVRTGAAPVDMSDFNRAAAAASDGFFIATTPAPPETTELIGTRAGRAVREVVEEVFAELEGANAYVGTSNGTAAPATTRAFSYPVVCVGVADEAAARDIAQVVDVIVTELSRTLPLWDLDGITFADDYAEALRSLDRGDPGLPPLETEALAYGVGSARCVEVVRDGVTKDHVVLAGWIGAGLLAEDVGERLSCAAIIAKELAKLGHGALYAREPASATPPDDVVRQVYDYANQAPSAYFSSRASAFICPEQGETYADLVQTSLAHARTAILEARLAYRTSGDLDALLAEALPCARAILGHAADWLGHRDGLTEGAAFPGDDLPRRLREEGLEAWLELFGRDLRNLYDFAGERLDPARLLSLGRHVERLMWIFQLFPWPFAEGGVYWTVPYGDDLALLAARGMARPPAP